MPRRRQLVDRGLLTIGALSAATGIPAQTIRTWERRYGFPRSERKPSGHRLYPLSTVGRLRRIAQAMARGHRAAEVVPASERVLDTLIATLPPSALEAPSPAASAPLPTSLAPADSRELFDTLRAFDADRLRRALQAEWASLGPLDFLERGAAPFLHAVGDAWATGALDVRHEHFASACVGDFLRAVRMPLDERAAGPVAALAALPGELHGIGLQMAALVFAYAGWRALVVGVDTPVAQIEALAREAPVSVVALSCVASPAKETAATIAALRRRIPRRVSLIVGGAGAPRTAPAAGVRIMPDLATLDRWLHARGDGPGDASG
ncbi:MAG TPA: cobalamin-dependent protein [Gemmatimonadaceae bacterium]